MDAKVLEFFDEHVRLLDMHVPAVGGAISIESAPADRGTIIICGDRLALIRLSITILRYAVRASLKEGQLQAEAMVVRELFPPPSRVTDIFLQINEAPITKRPRKSGWNLVADMVAALLRRRV